MKKIFFLVIIIGLMAFFNTKPTYSQVSEETSREKADTLIQEAKARVNDLKVKLQNTDNDIEKLKKDLVEMNKNIADCNKELYNLIGATPEDVDKYRQQLGILDGKIRDLKRLSDDDLADKQDQVKALEEEYKNTRNTKISLLPEFYNKVVGMGRDIKGLYREKKVKGYTVGTWAKDRDCLWNIAGKMEIYGDPLQWPKIWQSNTDKIKNPDIIKTGQLLTIPPAGPKSNDEMKAERKYWRQKHAAMEQQQTPEQQEKSQKGN